MAMGGSAGRRSQSRTTTHFTWESPMWHTTGFSVDNIGTRILRGGTGVDSTNWHGKNLPEHLAKRGCARPAPCTGVRDRNVRERH